MGIWSSLVPQNQARIGRVLTAHSSTAHHLLHAACAFLQSKKTGNILFSLPYTGSLDLLWLNYFMKLAILLRKRKMSDEESLDGAAVKMMKKETALRKLDANGERKNPLQTTLDSATGSKLTAPICQTHQKKTSLRTVRKAGENKGRLFYGCSNQGCKFFQVRIIV